VILRDITREYFCLLDLKTTIVSENNFHHYLSKFLVSRVGGKYQRNFLFNETFICGKKAPRIVITTIDIKFMRLTNPQKLIEAMDDSKAIVSEAQVHGYVTVWSKFFGSWTTDKLIGQEVLRNLILALICVMGTTAILIAEIQTCCWILLCVLLTLLNVCGFMYFWGLTIDLVSCIGEYVVFLDFYDLVIVRLYLYIKDKFKRR
jgi:hypothetical protein